MSTRFNSPSLYQCVQVIPVNINFRIIRTNFDGPLKLIYRNSTVLSPIEYAIILLQAISNARKERNLPKRLDLHVPHTEQSYTQSHNVHVNAT